METTLNIKETFKLALDQTISNYAEKAKADIGEFILHIAGEIRPYMVVTDSGAEALAEEIFTVEVRRDFIFNLLFNFCPRLSFTDTGKEFSKLTSTLAFSLSIADRVSSGEGPPNSRNGDTRNNKLPEEIVRRLPSRSSIVELLEANKWLTMLLLISLYVSVDDFVKAGTQ